VSERDENSGWEHDAARIAVVVVTFNSADVHPSVVAVVDNASEDEGVAIAEAETDLPTWIVQLGRNAGYAAAINAGIAALGTSASSTRCS
jgi:N-acetylglucosaminyl-diphospho-decaprenol L-rhamnosyltransferase